MKQRMTASARKSGVLSASQALAPRPPAPLSEEMLATSGATRSAPARRPRSRARVGLLAVACLVAVVAVASFLHVDAAHTAMSSVAETKVPHECLEVDALVSRCFGGSESASSASKRPMTAARCAARLAQLRQVCQ
jgi:hypothetical protein